MATIIYTRTDEAPLLEAVWDVYRAGGVVVARPDAPKRFGVELLSERRRVGDVAEDERDRLPDHEPSLGRFTSDDQRASALRRTGTA